jgi:hypothetical protein
MNVEADAPAQVSELEAAVAAAQAALERQRKAHEETVETLESQHKAQSRKQHQDMHTEKQAQQVRCGAVRRWLMGGDGRRF